MVYQEVRHNTGLIQCDHCQRFLYFVPPQPSGSLARSRMITVYIDGGSRGNPGPAGYGVQIVEDDGSVVAELHEFVGQTTNNVAEYHGLLAALGWALDRGLDALHVRSDSELLVKQLRGEYRVKNPGLQPLYQDARRLVQRIGHVTFEHVRRELNKQADRLANLAMDESTHGTVNAKLPIRSSVRTAIFVLLLALVHFPGDVCAQAPTAADAAWAALNDGDADKAARLFRQALSARPADPLLLLGAGIAAHQLGDDRQAEGTLRKALKISPQLTPAAAVLGRIVYDAGDLDQAIAIYERALKGVAGEPEMHEQLERWRKEAELHAGFEHGGTGRFAIMFEGPEERALADHISGVLETAYWNIGQRLNTYPTSTLEVILYTQQHFTDVTRSPDWAAGAYDGRIRLPVDGAMNDRAALDRVVVHELVHAMVHTLAPRGVPAWLHEGLAVSFEPGEKPWVSRTLGQSSALIPLESLRSGFSGLTSDEAQLAYAESAVAAGVIIKRLGPNLPAFLQGLESADSVDTGLAPFGFTTADIERSLRAQLRR